MKGDETFTHYFLFLYSSESVMAQLRKYISKNLQKNKESDTQYSKTETLYYFWSGNKYNQVIENIQGEFCQVIKVSVQFEVTSNITILNSLCDISGSYSASIIKTLSSSGNFNDDLSNKIYQQTNQLTEALGLCVKRMELNQDPLPPSEIVSKSSMLLLKEHGVAIEEEEEFIYTCQCNENYGYENCTPADPPINGINAGNVYCQIVDHILLDSADKSHIIFIDHAVFGRPMFWAKDPQNVVNK